MREIRLSGSEGGVADNGHLYPYQTGGPPGPNIYERPPGRCHSR